MQCIAWQCMANDIVNPSEGYTLAPGDTLPPIFGTTAGPKTTTTMATTTTTTKTGSTTATSATTTKTNTKTPTTTMATTATTTSHCGMNMFETTHEHGSRFDV